MAFIVTVVFLIEAMVLASTAYIEVVFIMPLVSFLFMLVLKGGTVSSRIIVSFFTILCLMSLIGQRQNYAYAWHGFIMEGIANPDYEYVSSRIPGLEGARLTQDTEIGYENIINAINCYTTKADRVYEFPHITLFNVLTERELGTYAVSHYMDVCPDSVLKYDLEGLEANPPALFLWNEWEDWTWDLHENLFRGGRLSASRDMIAFYNHTIQEDYSLVYRFRNIYVWAKEPDTKKNLDLAIARLNSVIYYYGDDEMKDAMARVSAADYQELYASEIPYSVGECMAYVISHTPELDNLLDDAFYEHLIPESKGEKMRQLKSTAVEDVDDEDDEERKTS